MDREKLDEVLSLNGNPVKSVLNHKMETFLQTQITSLEKIMKQQAATLLEERSLMKSEWDKERQVHDRTTKLLKQK